MICIIATVLINLDSIDLLFRSLFDTYTFMLKMADTNLVPIL